MIRTLLLAATALAVVPPRQLLPRRARRAPSRRRRCPHRTRSPSRARCRSRRRISRKIKDSDYLPALLAGMAQQKREVTAIANQPATPTFDNTVVAMERSGLLLERANLAFSAVNGANTNDMLQATDTKTVAAVRRAQRLHLSQRQAVPALQISSRPSGRAEPQPRAGEAARRLLQAVRPRRRRAAAGQAGAAQGDEHSA